MGLAEWIPHSLSFKKGTAFRRKDDRIPKAARRDHYAAVSIEKFHGMHTQAGADVLDVEQGHGIIGVALTAKAATLTLELRAGMVLHRIST